MTVYEITYERVGRHGSRRDGMPPAPPAYQVTATDPDHLAKQIHADVRRYLGSRDTEVVVDLEHMTGHVLAGGVRTVGSFTVAVLEEEAAPAAEPGPVELPAVTKAGRNYLDHFVNAVLNEQPIHVYRTPDKPGSGVSKPALERLLRDGLVQLGDYVPLKGRPVYVTDLGHQVLDATKEA